MGRAAHAARHRARRPLDVDGRRGLRHEDEQAEQGVRADLRAGGGERRSTSCSARAGGRGRSSSATCWSPSRTRRVAGAAPHLALGLRPGLRARPPVRGEALGAVRRRRAGWGRHARSSLGSHKLFARYLATDADPRSTRRPSSASCASHPWLRGADRATTGARPQRALPRRRGGHRRPPRPAWWSSTGEAGDVFVTHGWVFHSIPVNAGTRPRCSCAYAMPAVYDAKRERVLVSGS